MPSGTAGAIVLYAAASIATFVTYWRDKSAAERGQWRTRERTLHLLSLVGGWPGALIAQKVFRHKTRKLSFQVVFWLTVIANCLGAWWIWSAGA